MKKTLLLILFNCLWFSQTKAQAPQGINYQGIARSGNGDPILGQAISLEFSIYDQLVGGNMIYSEAVGKTTDPVSGIFTHVIGNGSPSFGTFNTINWSAGLKFLEVKLNGTSLGRQQMMSVPYALYAEKAGNAGSPSLSVNGTNLSISGGNTVALPNSTTSITGVNAASVTSLGNNSFVVSVPQVSLTGTGATSVSGSFPNFTVNTVTAGSPSLTGIGTTTVISGGNNFTIGTPPVNLSYVPATGILSYSPSVFPGTLAINPTTSFTNGVLSIGPNTVNIPGTGLWTKPDPTVTALTNGSDWLGVGTNTPLSRMDVVSMGNNFITSRSIGNGFTGFMIDRPASNVPGYIIFRNGGADMWTVGTHSNSMNYMIYNWAFSRPDISVNYTNGFVGINTTTPSTQLQVNGTLTVVDGLEANGKFLVSNSTGNANWRSSPQAIAFGGLNQNSILVSTSPTTLITSAMSFNKVYSTSEIVIDLNTRAYHGVFGGGASYIIYEVRVDGNTTPVANQYASTNSNNTEFISIHAVFNGLSAGNHVIHITAYTVGGSSSGVVLDPGGFGGKVIVKEHL